MRHFFLLNIRKLKGSKNLISHLSSFPSSLNFFIYCFVSKIFRKSLLKLLSVSSCAVKRATAQVSDQAKQNYGKFWYGTYHIYGISTGFNSCGNDFNRNLKHRNNNNNSIDGYEKDFERYNLVITDVLLFSWKSPINLHEFVPLLSKKANIAHLA